MLYIFDIHKAYFPSDEHCAAIEAASSASASPLARTRIKTPTPKLVFLGTCRRCARTRLRLLGRERLHACEVMAAAMLARGARAAARIAAQVAALGPAGPLIAPALRWAARVARRPRGALASTRLRFVCVAVVLSRLGAARRAQRRRRVATAAHALRRAGRRALEYAALATAPHLPRHLAPLNSFLDFGEAERVEWLSALLAALWGTLDWTVDTLTGALLEPMLDELRPTGISKMGLDTFTLGAVAPEVVSMQTVVVGGSAERGDRRQTGVASHGELIVMAKVRWRGEPNIAFSVRGPLVYGNVAPLSVHVTNLSVEGTLCVRLAPLMSCLPLVGGLSISFPEMPAIDYDLAAVPLPGMPAVHLDAFFGLNETLRQVLRYVVRDTLVAPHSIPIVLDTSTRRREAAIRKMLTEHPLGYLHVRVERARGLMASDRGGTSDPYVIAGLVFRKVGRREQLGRGALRSEVQLRTLDPEFRWKASFPVFAPSVESLLVRVMDWDEHTRDDFLGSVRLEVGTLSAQPGTEVQGWFPLSLPSRSKRHRRAAGDVYLRAMYTTSSAGGWADGDDFTGMQVAERARATPSFYRPKRQTSDADADADTSEGEEEGEDKRPCIEPPKTPRSSTAAFKEHVLKTPAVSRCASVKRVGSADCGKKLQCGELSQQDSSSNGASAAPWRQSGADESTRFAKSVARHLGLTSEVHLGTTLAARDAALLPLNIKRRELGRLCRAIAPSALPIWTRSEAWERAYWLDTIVCTLWPLLRSAVAAEVERLNELGLVGLLQCVPHATQGDRLLAPRLRLDLGELPPIVEAVHASRSVAGGSRAEVTLDIALRLAGDLSAEVKIVPLRNPLAACSARLSELQLLAKIRVRLHPLMPTPPLIGGVSVSLLDDPTLDAAVNLRLSPLLPPLPLLDLPLVQRAKRWFIRGPLRRLLGDPAFAHVPLVDDGALALASKGSEAAGILTLDVLSGANLISADWNGKADPYVVAMLDAEDGNGRSGANPYPRRARFSRTQHNTLSPSWVGADGAGQRLSFKIPARVSELRLWLGVFDSDRGSRAVATMLGFCGMRAVQRLAFKYEDNADVKQLVADAEDKESIDTYKALTEIPWSPKVKGMMSGVKRLARAIKMRSQATASDGEGGHAESQSKLRRLSAYLVDVDEASESADEGHESPKASSDDSDAGHGRSIQDVIEGVRFLPFGKCTPREMLEEECVGRGSDFMGLAYVDLGDLSERRAVPRRELHLPLAGVERGELCVATTFTPFLSADSAERPTQLGEAARGTLFVELVRGADLKSAWVPDRALMPEVKLTLGSESFKSSPGQGGSCFWRQTFQFGGIDFAALSQSLGVLVRHRPDSAGAAACAAVAGAVCTGKGGREIGSGTVFHLADIAHAQSGDDVMLDLRSPTGGSAGRILLHIVWRSLV